MAISVTPNAVKDLFAGKLQSPDAQPVVQVLDVKEIASANAAAKGPVRYRMVVSDGDAFLQSMAGSDVVPDIVNKHIVPFSLIKLKEYTMNQVGANNKRVLVIISVEVVGSLSAKIGAPVAVDKAEAKAEGDAAMPAAAAAPAPAAAAAAPTVAPAAAAAGNASRPATAFGKPFASPPFKAGSAGAGAGASPSQASLARESNVRPISSLNPYQKGWAIKARVAVKSQARKWDKGNSHGRLFSVDLVDAQGGQIRATMFNAAADKFDAIFEEKKVYIIAKGVLKVANQRFNKLPNDYEITLNEDAEVVPVADAGEIKMQQFEFVRFSDLNDVKAEAHVDVLGVVTKAGPIGEITGRVSGKQMTRRALTLVDSTNHSIELTLWGDDAKLDLNPDANPVIAVKAVRVSDFGGKSLSSTFQSRIYVNPTDIAEAVALRSWYDGEGKMSTPQFLSGVRNGEGAGPAPRKTFSAIKDDKLGLTRYAGKDGTQRTGDYFTVRGTVVYFRADYQKPPWYMACQKCNKKMADSNHCQACNETKAPVPRYILSFLACDHTGGHWMTAFNEQAQKLLGQSAEQLAALHATSEDAFKAAFNARNFRQYVFRVRAQEDTGRDGQGGGADEQRVRCHVMDATQIFSHDSTLIAEANGLVTSLESVLGAL